MAEKRTAPAVRYAEFTDAWEQRKLGELGKVFTGNTPPTAKKGNWSSDENGYVWITPTDINALLMSNSERHLTEKGWVKARTIPKNSVLITSIASIGKNAINTVPAAFNQQINAIVPEGNDAYFILSAMEKDTARFAGIAGQTATPIINKTGFEAFAIFVPSYIEQKEIGTLFADLDRLLTLHQCELKKLQNMKKALLEKMFPCKSVSAPEIRFAGFMDAWEQRKLGDILNTYSFKPYLKEPKNNGDYEVIQQGDRPVIGFADGNPFTDYQAVTLFGDHTVSLYKPNKPFFVATDGLKILGADGMEGNFFFTLLERYKPEPQGYKRHFAILANQSAWVTYNTDEQQKIGTLFMSLDRLLTLHQRALKKLQNMKKALLEKLFV